MMMLARSRVGRPVAGHVTTAFRLAPRRLVPAAVGRWCNGIRDLEARAVSVG
jgi:hypothetical protein